MQSRKLMAAILLSLVFLPLVQLSLWQVQMNSSLASEINPPGQRVDTPQIAGGDLGMTLLDVEDIVEPSGATYGTNILMMDVDNDSTIELVANTRGPYGITHAVGIYNYTTGTLQREGYYTVSDTVWSTEAGDVDGDNKIELLVGCRNCHFYILEWNGTSFTTQQDTTYTGETRVFFGQLDDDTDKELVIAEGWQRKAIHFLDYNVGSGQFTQTDEIITSDGPFMWGIIDLDGDGRDEACVGIAADTNLHFYGYNASSGRYVNEQQFNFGQVGCRVADFDYDGMGEIVRWETTANCSYWDNSTGSFAKKSELPDSVGFAVCMPMQMDNDSNLEVVLSPGSSNTLRVAEVNWSTGNFCWDFNLTLDAATGVVAESNIDIYLHGSADDDGDGHREIAFFGQNDALTDPQISLYELNFTTRKIFNPFVDGLHFDNYAGSLECLFYPHPDIETTLMSDKYANYLSEFPGVSYVNLLSYLRQIVKGHPNGHCFGMSKLVLDYFTNCTSPPNGTQPHDLELPQIRNEIEYLHDIQLFNLSYYAILYGVGERSSPITNDNQWTIIRESLEAGHPIIITLMSSAGKHAVLGYDLNEEGNVLIYDPSCPATFESPNRFIQPWGDGFMVRNSIGSLNITLWDYCAANVEQPSLVQWYFETYKLNSVWVLAQCPVQLQIFDAQGNEIGDTVSDGQTHITFLFNPVNQNYKIKLKGTGTGSYNLTVTRQYNSGATVRSSLGEVVAGQVVEFTLTINDGSWDLMSPGFPWWMWVIILGAAGTATAAIAWSVVRVRKLKQQIAKNPA